MQQLKNHRCLSLHVVAFSSALASSTVDKCQAVGGTDGSYSTQTACQLLETLHPLHELLGVMKSSIVPNGIDN